MSEKEKRAPVQGFSAGIPWTMHLRAYDAYCQRYSPQPALIDLEGRNCRGGFAVSELDQFIPGWREELSEIAALREQLAQAQKFKAFVHDYLTQHGVPEGDPANQHQIQGCRIGARLDLLFQQLAEAGAALESIRDTAITLRDASRISVLHVEAPERIRARAVAALAAITHTAGPQWRQRPPDEMGLWWWWNQDEDSLPIVVDIQYSGCAGTYFASIGQHGWNQPQNVTEMGGVWIRLHEPSTRQ